MLSDTLVQEGLNAAMAGLNAPFGARCFLTTSMQVCQDASKRLNAPFGARRFLTRLAPVQEAPRPLVLMHLLALGAF